MSKYIDLAKQVIKASDIADEYACLDYDRGIDAALKFLDLFPECAPGRTITESEYAKDQADWGIPEAGAWLRGFYCAGGQIIPDPVPTNAEPTNAGHDRDWWVENANVNDIEDCEACEGDLCPVHYGISMGIDLMAKKIAALGDDPELFALIPDPVKATEEQR